MKRSTLHLMLLSGTFIAFFALDSFAQQVITTCWDFEEPCANPADAFHQGCIPNAQSASGSPDTQSDYAGIGAFSGAKYAHMYARYCFVEPGELNRHHTEGIILRHNFVAGVQYKISFAVRSLGTQAPTETKVILVNDMPNYGGIGTPGLGCLNTLDLLPNIPANSETIATYAAADISGNGWESKTITWTPQSNFNQIWFRPKAISPVVNGEIWTDLYLDRVCLEEGCPPVNFSYSYCREQGSNQLVLTINGGTGQTNHWILHQANDCMAGTRAQNFGPVVPINWLPNNTSFTLPLNSGCYILVYSDPQCILSTHYFFIYTAEEEVPLCDGPCVDGHLIMNQKFCSGVNFEAISDPDPGQFPSGTNFTFTLDGMFAQYGFNPEYFIPLSGPNQLSHGWHTVCVTIEEYGCEPIEQCINFFNDCFQGPANDRKGTNMLQMENFQVSNPAHGSIRLPYSLDTGTANLYSVQGTLVKSFVLHGEEYLDVAELTTGQYILTIQSLDHLVSNLVYIQNQ